MRAWEVVGKVCTAMLVVFVGAISLFVILHEIRGRQARRESEEAFARFDVLDKMEADGFSNISIADTKQFVETRKCYDFKISATASSGEAVWGHFIQCDQIDGSELVNYVVNDFCAEGAINCQAERQEYKCK